MNPYVELGGIAASTMKTGGRDGGCGCAGKFFGGDEDFVNNIADYDQTANSAAMSNVISKLGGFVQEATGASSKSAQLAKIGGFQLEGAGRQARATEMLNDSLRAKFGGCKIGGAEAMPKNLASVIEFVKGLNIGERQELAGMRAAMTKILANMRAMLREIEGKVDVLRASVSPKAENFKGVPTAYELYKAAADELGRQVNYLANMVDVNLPNAEGEVAKIINNLSDISAFDAQLGSSEYRKHIQGILTQSVLTVESSKYIQDLLKKFGKDMKDYKSMKGIGDLAVAYADAVRGKKLTDEQERDLQKAFAVLTNNFGIRDTINPEVLATMERKTGGMNIPDVSMYSGGMNIPDVSMYSGGNTAPLFTGGAPAGPVYDPQRKSEVEKRIESRKSVRNILLQAFQRQITSAYDVVIVALHALSDKIGSEIPLTDHLDTFRANLVRLKSGAFDNKNLYLALIGYFNDVSSKAEKEEKVGALNMVISYCESLMAMKEYAQSSAHFRALADALRGVIAVIDKYTEEVVAKFGAGEPATPAQVAKMGGDPELDKVVSKMTVSRIKPAKTIDDAISKFDYYYRAAQIQTNLKAAGQDLKGYGEKYGELVAKSIATILQEERNKYDKAKKILNKFPLKEDANSIYKEKSLADAAKVNAGKFLDETWETKRKFWRTIEALDMYMKAFTDGIVNNPDDIRDIKAMLDEVPVVSDIYSSKSGDHLTKVFDLFPSNMADENVSTAASRDHDATYLARDGNHYYEKLTGKAAAANAPGNPHIVAPPEVGHESKKEAGDLLRNLYFLKNLISVFVHIGSKFGGAELQKKIGLSPLHIYDNITAYLQCSAYAQGFNTGGDFQYTGVIANDEYSSFDAGGSSVEIGPNFAEAGFAGDVGAGAFDSTITTGRVKATGKASTVRAGSSYKASGVLIGVGALDTEFDYTNDLNRLNHFLRVFGVHMRSVIPDIAKYDTGFSWQLEDNYFAILMKAMCAKIFTVVGTYDLFDRPLEFNGLSSIRMILGGTGAMPKVDSACVELYLRLPLLLEFYRNIFGYDSEDGYATYGNDAKNPRMYPHKQTALKIAMIPDVDGVFGGIIKVIFRNARFVVGQNYSDEDISAIISECNSIYQKMTAKYDASNVVRMTVNELVNEINRRYGVISKDIRNAYEEDLGRNRTYRDYSDKYRDASESLDLDGAREYSILPDEEATGTSQQISAAEMYLGADLTKPSVSNKTIHRIGLGHKDLLYRFRSMVENDLRGGSESFSFARAIRVARERLAKAGTDEERFKVIASMVRGKEITNTRDSLSYLLFHETVVVGLNTLSAIHTLLARFKRRAALIDIQGLEDEFWAYCHAISTIGGRVAAAGEISASPNDGRSFIQWLIHRDPVANAAVPAANKKQAGLIGSLFDAPEEALAHIRRLIHNFNASAGAVDLSLHNTTVDAAATPAFATAQNGNLMSMLIINGKNLASYPAAYKATENSDQKNIIQAFFHGLFDPQYVMREFIESVFGLGADLQGLVEVKVHDNRVSISLHGLKKCVDELFQSVNHYLELLRPVVSEDFIQPYVSKTTPGSYYWLQEQINEKIFSGRDIVKLGEEANFRYISLDRVVQKLDYTWNWLTQKYLFSCDGLTGGVGAAPISMTALAAGATYDQFKFGNLFAELVYYDASKQHSGIVGSELAKGQNAAPSLVAALSDPYESLHFAGPQGQKVMDTRFAARFKQLYSFGDEFTFNRSVMFSFNQLVAKFIKQFYDPSTQKIYQGLLSPLANGPMSQACMDHLYTYPDIVPTLFVKGSKPDATKIPSYAPIVAKIKDMGNADTFAEILQTYWKSTGGLSDAFKWSKYGNSDLIAFGTGGAQTMPKLYVKIFLTAIGMLAYEAYSRAHANAVARVNNNPLNAACISAGLAVLIRTALTPSANMYSAAALPTIKAANTIDTADKLYNEVDNSLAKINGTTSRTPEGFAAAFIRLADHANGAAAAAQIKHAMTSADAIVAALFAYAGGTLYGLDDNAVAVADFDGAAGTAAAFVGYVANSPEAMRINRIFSTIQTLLQTPNVDARAGAALGAASIGKALTTIVQGVAVVQDTTPQQIESATKLIAYATVYVWEGFDDAAHRNIGVANMFDGTGVLLVDADCSTRINTAITMSQQVPQSYVPGRAQEPQMQAKYEDLLSTQMNNIFSAPDSTDSISYILAARQENGGPIGANSIDRPMGAHPSPPLAGTKQLADIQQFGRRADPDYQHVLFTSLATIIKNIISSRAANQTLVYVLDNVADITLYMKERLRANLPGFKLLFNELVNRAEFLKHLTREASALNLGRPNAVVAAATINPWPFVLQTVADTSDAVRTRQHGILDTVIRAAAAMVTACDKVLTEIGDEPKFMEIYQNSIKDYRARYSVDPFMPLSSITKVYANIREKPNGKGTCGYTEFLPFSAPGSDEMKYLYGTRGIFGHYEKNPSLDQAPGFVAALEMGALGLTSGQVDKKRMEGFYSVIVRAARYIFECRHLKGNLTTYNLHPTGAAGGVAADLPVAIAAQYSGANSVVLYSTGSFVRDDMIINVNRQNTNTARGNNPNVPYGDANNINVNNRCAMSIIIKDGLTIRVVKFDKDAYNVAAVGGIAIKDEVKPTYAITHTANEIVQMVESSFRDERIKELVKYTAGTTGSQQNLPLQNIIDLNIVPINVHALMRDIPLANLYNYSFSFDKMIVELYYGLQNKNALELIKQLYQNGNPGKDESFNGITSAKDMLVALLLNPYREVLTNVEFESFAKGMLTGATAVDGLSRPKFLSDQVYGSAIFGELYSDPSVYSEMGPAAPSSGASRVKITDALMKVAIVTVITAVLRKLTGSLAFQNIWNINNQGAANQAIFEAIADAVLINPRLSVMEIGQVVNDLIAFEDDTGAGNNGRPLSAPFRDAAGQGPRYVALGALRTDNSHTASAAIITAVFARVITYNLFHLANALENALPAKYDSIIARHRDLLAYSLAPAYYVGEHANPNSLLGVHTTDNAQLIAAFVRGPYAIAYTHDAGGQAAARNNAVANAPDFNAQWPRHGASYTANDWPGAATFVLGADGAKYMEGLAALIARGARSIPVGRPRADPGGVRYTVAIGDVDLPATAEIRAFIAISRQARVRARAEATLHYLDTSSNAIADRKTPDNENTLDSAQVKTVAIDANLQLILAMLSRIRFDTVFVRNLIFIVNLYRTVRLKLSRDLTYNREIIQSSAAITKDSLTEYFGNQVWTPRNSEGWRDERRKRYEY